LCQEKSGNPVGVEGFEALMVPDEHLEVMSKTIRRGI
jgi:hypothetical protein